MIWSSDISFDSIVDPRMMSMPPHQDVNFSQPPPGYVPMNIPPPGLPDLSKPPPGFPQAPPVEPCRPEELIPSVPYFELPAGLMVSLVKVLKFLLKRLAIF
jgi:calcium homeostasis endoplasmic reticulum protein